MDTDRREAALDELIARAEIFDCVKRFCRGMDRLDRELMLSAFHPDAIDDHVVICDRPDTFADWAIALHSTNHASTNHYLTNHSVDIDGDSAHSETYVFLIGELRDPSQPLQLIGARYVDRFERRDGTWGIIARVCVTTFVSELPRLGQEEHWQALLGSDMIARDRSDISYQRPLTTREPGSVDVSDLPATVDPRSMTAT